MQKGAFASSKCSRILFRIGNKKLGLSVKGSPSFDFMALLLGAIHHYFERYNCVLREMQ